ncbi:MAG TPA: protein-disulfide reductase DsbD domain-containing protein, partial [Thermoanaerobaculia bacterium]|nr:protein-disulfide reductase DsbD domain-containing protein [Thermoanaerobaculia bacterium]
MKSRAVVLLLLLTGLTLPLAAQEAGLPPPGVSLGPSPGGEAPPEHLVSVAIAVAEGGRKSGDAVRGTLGITIAEGWHINSAHPKDDFSIPTVAKLVSPGARFEDLAYPPHVERPFTFAGGELLAVYEGSIAIPFQGTRTMDGAIAIDATVSYQACNDRVCLPPRSETARVEIGADGIAAAGTPAPNQAVPEGGFMPLSEAPAAQGGLFSGDIGSTFESRGLALTLLVVFVLGL